MDTGLIELRFLVLFSFILGSGALYPGVPEGLSQKLILRWNRIKKAIRSFRARCRRASSRSFWVIDLTRIEP